MSRIESVHVRPRILVVEDNLFVRDAIGRILARDTPVDLASSVKEAKPLMQERAHIGWIIDLHLPDGSGLDLIDWGRKKDPYVPALLITGGSLEHDLVNEVEARGVALLAKPFDATRCRRFVERCGGAHTAALIARAERIAEAHGLSPRETDILRARVRGVPRAALELELGIKETTVRTLIRRMLQRTNHGSLDELLDVVLSAD